MHAAVRNCRTLAVSTKARGRAAARPYGLSAFDILAGGVHGFFAVPAAREDATPQDTGDRRGLDGIERKTALSRLGRAAAGEAGSLATDSVATGSAATVWISVPFAVVFVLGCLTFV
jgi:hypothetical protein